MKILHTADWHIGNFRSPMKNGVNLRSEDTKRCLDELVRVAKAEQPDFALISGDVFHVGRLWSDRCCEEIITAIHYIRELSAASKHVVVMRGTPNHDGEGQFNVLSEMFADCRNVHIITTPQVLSFEEVDIAVLPGFDRGVFRAKFPGLSKEEENEVFTQELSNIILGLKAQCRPEKTSVLMAHYTVPGCNTESGQTMLLTQFEPIIPQEALSAAGYDLVALGHIHRPQQILSHNWYYSGAVNAMNFNDEGQERGFWIHELPDFGVWGHTFYNTPIREFITFDFTDTDVTAINFGHIDEVAFNFWRYNGAVKDKIIRIHYTCSAEKDKAFKLNRAELEKTLLDDGAFMVWEILPDKIEESANRAELANTTDPEVNLIKYLEEKQMPPEKIQELALLARPIIAEAEASMTTAANTGTFEPVEISVKNYRNYKDETFSFEDITFCTINGQNGAGKSSLFMDAIIDCLYEEPREGSIKDDSGKSPWLRNDEEARSGSIMFTFRIGEKTYRVTRTRARSGKGTLNISQFANGEWFDCSKERYNDTQQEILNIIGMDSFTFKSCALIMQDQYGLFLQAKPEARIEVLGTLLGLGVYQIMEKIAKDRGSENTAKSRAINQEIEIHEGTISELGIPDYELDVCKGDLEALESRLKRKIDERDKYKLILVNQQAAAERHFKLLASINTLQSKKVVKEEARKAQQEIVDRSAVILDGKKEIEEKTAEHKALLERKLELAGESALYLSKKQDIENLTRQAVAEQETVDSYKAQGREKEKEMSAAQSTEDDEFIRKNAADYEHYAVLLKNMTELQLRHTEALAEREHKAYAVDSKRAFINQELSRLNAKKSDLERRAELLADSGCPDAENAKCRFLLDAIDAKQQIPVVDAEIAIFAQEQDKALRQLVKELEAADEKIVAVGFHENELLEYRRKVAELSGAPDELKKLEERTSRIALIQADLEHLQSNISEAEKRLSEVKLKGMEAERECDIYAKSFEEHGKVLNSIIALEPWLEKAKQLPVAEERSATALNRVSELTTELANIDAEIAEKQEEADKEILAMSGMEETGGFVESLNVEVDSINSLVREKQMRIGALQHKVEQVSKLKKEISRLRAQQVEYAKESADYDTLRTAFSQSGVPHQIIRSIVPQLMSTSNAILGQMTGGKMGVDFRLEKFQKNGKEKVSLDIFIEESGKAALPYLSKSGGEKVKASLSVILGLAEIKSSSAGIQLGMLFIDEPPFLDSDGIQAYCDALETIRNRYSGMKIMAITHDPTMKARFPQSLDVVKTEEGSRIIY